MNNIRGYFSFLCIELDSRSVLNLMKYVTKSRFTYVQALKKFGAMPSINSLFLLNGLHDKRSACKMVVIRSTYVEGMNCPVPFILSVLERIALN